tara:strand:+ start:53 stop:751 length:699 start_codon:yes stop_codon:yes gene_type:complete
MPKIIDGNNQILTSGYGTGLTTKQRNAINRQKEIFTDTQAIKDESGDTRISFTDAGGFDIISDTATAAGGGVVDAAKNTFTVSEINGITRTVGLIDIQGLTSDATDTGAIGKEGVAAAFFTKLTHEINGYIHFAQITCVEAPTGGEIDLDLVFDTTSTAEGVAVTDVVITGAGDWTLGESVSSDNKGGTHIVLTSGLDDHFVYLAVGTSSSPTNGTYTAGKYVIVLEGVKVF